MGVVNPYQLRDDMLSAAGLPLPWKKGEPKDIIVEERGRIIPVADGEFRSVMIIESKKGVVRANHYHKTDSHVMYIISGRARYVEALINDGGGIVSETEYGPGDAIITAPLVPHAIEFIEDTVMIVCARNERDTETYLKDIVKVTLV